MKRFFDKVQKTSTCWLWTASKIHSGYGEFWTGEKKVLAHRWSWENVNGPIPAGLVIDHLCRTPACVNPEHLRVVTSRVNILCGTGPAAKHAAKTHCSKGHEFSPENTSVRRTGHRDCRTCKIAACKDYWKRIGGPRRSAKRAALRAAKSLAAKPPGEE